MPFVNNQGIKIHYEVEGKGSPLILMHSLCFRLESWINSGYVAELKENFQIILVDTRGHGQSDKPDALEEYSFKILAKDVIAVMDGLNIKKAHYYGYSMGAYIGFHGIAKYFLSRFNSLVLGGFSVYPGGQATQSLSMAESAIEKGIQVWISFFEQMYGVKLTPAQQSYFLTLNPRALYNIMKKISESYLDESNEQTLSQINIPCLIYAGEDDPNFAGAKKAASKMHDSRFLPISGLNHTAAFIHSELILPYVKKFLKEVGKS